MKLLLLTVFTVILGSSLILGQTLQDDPKVDLEGIKKLLDQLEKKQIEDLQGDFESFTQDLVAGLNSEEEGVKFYQACVRRTDFEGKALDSKEWNEWKGKNEAMLGDKNFKKWISFQLRYFQLWGKAYKKTELSQLQESLLGLCFEIRNSILSFEKEKKDKPVTPDFRAQSVGVTLSGSYFSKAYRLEPLLKETKGWDLVLSSSEQILDKLFMEGYRSSKDLRLFDLWGKRLEWADLVIKYSSLSNEQKYAHENDLLTLQWKQAQDLRDFGLQNKAVNLMFTIVSKAPDHPQFESRIKEIRAILGIKSSLEK